MRDSGTEVSDTVTLLTEMAAPQKERVGFVKNAAAGAVVTLVCVPPAAMALSSKLADSASTSAVTLPDSDGGKLAAPPLAPPRVLDKMERT